MNTPSEQQDRVEKFIKEIVKSLTPAVIEAVQRGASGHFEVHYSGGSFTRAFRKDGL